MNCQYYVFRTCKLSAQTLSVGERESIFSCSPYIKVMRQHVFLGSLSSALFRFLFPDNFFYTLGGAKKKLCRFLTPPPSPPQPPPHQWKTFRVCVFVYESEYMCTNININKNFRTYVGRGWGWWRGTVTFNEVRKLCSVFDFIFKVQFFPQRSFPFRFYDSCIYFGTARFDLFRYIRFQLIRNSSWTTTWPVIPKWK